LNHILTLLLILELKIKVEKILNINYLEPLYMFAKEELKNQKKTS